MQNARFSEGTSHLEPRVLFAGPTPKTGGNFDDFDTGNNGEKVRPGNGVLNFF